MASVILITIISALSVGGAAALVFGFTYLPTLYEEYVAQPEGEVQPPDEGWDSNYQHYAIVNEVNTRSNGIVDITFAPANNSGSFRKTFRTQGSQAGNSYPPLDILTNNAPESLEGHAFAAEFQDGDWQLLDVERYNKTKAPVTSPTLLNHVKSEINRNKTAVEFEERYESLTIGFFATGTICALALAASPTVIIGGFGSLLLSALLLVLLPVSLMGLYPFWLTTQEKILDQFTRTGKLHQVYSFNDIERGQTVSFTYLDGTYRVIDVQPQSGVFVVQDTEDPLLITPIRLFQDPVKRPRYTCYTPFSDDGEINGLGYCGPANDSS